MLSTKALRKRYGNLEVLKGVSMVVNEAEIVSVVGASGAGKSTLLHILGTLERPDSGELLIRNTDVFALKAKALAEFRNKHIGFVFQFHHLLPEFTALENICMPAWIHGQSKAEAEKEAHRLLELLQLDARAHHRPSELSGGEQQRVAIARALINKPAVVLADEPTGNLDTQNSMAIFSLLNELRHTLKQTFILVTHNDELSELCDRSYTMRDGQLELC
ncbi:MAG: ABC transporter ATP-binding protein [Chitinophagaceae bacterium]